MPSLRATVGERLKVFRKLAGLTQEQLAKKASIDPKYVGDLETGRKAPSFEVLEELLRVLNVEPSEFFAFSLKLSKPVADTDEAVLADLVRRAGPTDRRLMADLLKAVLRSRGAEKK
jgi:transcriptional regulator with XRE-family HTH domain